MVIGVTGRSCSGKDEVVHLLEERGLESVNVDKLGHRALEMNKERLFASFGPSIFDHDGKVDRKVLGPIVFSSPEKLEELNNITHPWMVEEVEAFIRERKISVINAALLESMNLVPLCDDILYVYAPLNLRKERAIKRDGLSEAAFLKRNESQKEIGSTLFESGKRVITIINDKDREYLYRQVAAYCDILLRRGYLDE